MIPTLHAWVDPFDATAEPWTDEHWGLPGSEPLPSGTAGTAVAVGLIAAAAIGLAVITGGAQFTASSIATPAPLGSVIAHGATAIPVNGVAAASADGLAVVSVGAARATPAGITTPVVLGDVDATGEEQESIDGEAIAVGVSAAAPIGIVHAVGALPDTSWSGSWGAPYRPFAPLVDPDDDTPHDDAVAVARGHQMSTRVGTVRASATATAKTARGIVGVCRIGPVAIRVVQPRDVRTRCAQRPVSIVKATDDHLDVPTTPPPVTYARRHTIAAVNDDTEVLEIVRRSTT